MTSTDSKIAATIALSLVHLITLNLFNSCQARPFAVAILDISQYFEYLDLGMLEHERKNGEHGLSVDPLQGTQAEDSPHYCLLRSR